MARDKQCMSFLAKHLGWLMVAVTFVELFMVAGPTYNYNILFVTLHREFNATAAATSWVGSLANAVLGGGGLISTPLIHRFGPRTVSLLGAVVLSSGLLTTSFAPTITYVFLTFGFLVGLGANLIFQSVVHLIYLWFPTSNCTRAISAALLGTSCSVLGYSVLLAVLIETYSLRYALQILAGANFIITFGFGVFITTPKVVKVETSIDKVEKDCEDTKKAGSAVRIAGTVGQRLIKALLRVEAWFYIIGITTSILAWAFFTVNYASFLEYDLYFSTQQATISIVLLAAGDLMGKFIQSLFGKHVQHVQIYLIAFSNVLGAVSSGVIPLFEKVSIVYMASFFVGITRSGVYALAFSAPMEIFGSYGLDIVTIISMMPFGIGSLLGPPLFGCLFDLTGDYTLTLHVIAAIFVCSAVAILTIPIARKIRSKKLKRATRVLTNTQVPTVQSPFLPPLTLTP